MRRVEPSTSVNRKVTVPDGRRDLGVDDIDRIAAATGSCPPSLAVSRKELFSGLIPASLPRPSQVAVPDSVAATPAWRWPVRLPIRAELLLSARSSVARKGSRRLCYRVKTTISGVAYVVTNQKWWGVGTAYRIPGESCLRTGSQRLCSAEAGSEPTAMVRSTGSSPRTLLAEQSPTAGRSPRCPEAMRRGPDCLSEAPCRASDRLSRYRLRRWPAARPSVESD
jgi:hypothetical protein